MLERQIVLIEFRRGGHGCTSIWIIFALRSYFTVLLLIYGTCGYLVDVSHHYVYVNIHIYDGKEMLKVIFIGLYGIKILSWTFSHMMMCKAESWILKYCSIMASQHCMLMFCVPMNTEHPVDVWHTLINDSIWRRGSGSTLAQMTARCLTAPSHYLSQYIFNIKGVSWYPHLHEKCPRTFDP